MVIKLSPQARLVYTDRPLLTLFQTATSVSHLANKKTEVVCTRISASLTSSRSHACSHSWAEFTVCNSHVLIDQRTELYNIPLILQLLSSFCLLLLDVLRLGGGGVCVYVFMCLCVYTCMCVNVCVCNVCVYAYMFVYVYGVCVYVCVCSVVINTYAWIRTEHSISLLSELWPIANLFPDCF